MIAKPKQYYTGLGLIIGFGVVLLLFFLPFYGEGRNGLNFLDNLYNSISKGSAYYIPKVKEESERFVGDRVAVTLSMTDSKQAEQTALLFKAGGAETAVNGRELKVTGDLGKILANAVEDADTMYKNDGKKVEEKYGYDERAALFNWWQAMQRMEKALAKEKKFKEAKIIVFVQQKALEPSYNYYKVEAQKIGDRWATVAFSLFFYVIYTLWYGFAMLFMFEGWGLKVGH
jgi:hypothetical protein